MPESTLLLLIALIVLSTLTAGVLIGWQGRKFLDRIERLEKAAGHRLPYKVADGLEDCVAVTNDISFQNADADKVISTLLTVLHKSEATRAYMNTRYGQLLETLQTLRTNPDGYDPDAPNKKRQV